MVQCSPFWLSGDFVEHGRTLKLRREGDDIIISRRTPYNVLAPIP
jgi:hypothetical protein